MFVNKIELKFSPNNKYIIITYFKPLERTLERNLLPNKMMENLELPMCLLDWIDKDKINWSALSSNPNAEAIALLKKNLIKSILFCFTFLIHVFLLNYLGKIENSFIYYYF